MNYFIADLHNRDENILQYEHRPFTTTEEMKDAIVSNWNNIVNNHDIVYLLGDIGNPGILSELKGDIIIVAGNHDNIDQIHMCYPRIKIYDKPIMVENLWLSHEPIGYMPPEIPYLNIHGHTHRFNYGLLNREWKEGNRYFCVSVEQIDYTPISEDEIAKRIKYVRG